MTGNDLITVVTPTMGDSCGHLNRQMVDLRAFTNLPFRQVVCDDGTLDEGQRRRQRQVSLDNGAEWFENPGPVWGISYNFNHALEQVRTPWAFLVEDGLRPGLGWLETAVDAVEKIGQRKWRGSPVGMMGTASFESWHLAMAGVLPSSRPFADFANNVDADCYSAFWGSSRHPNWNDGLMCWRRLLPRMQAACASKAADAWPAYMQDYRRIILTMRPPHVTTASGRNPSRPWPTFRSGGCAWFPGAFMILNVGAWRAVGRMRDGCPFFEGHLGIRMARHGWLSLAIEFPPWLHDPGMGFRSANRMEARTPRHHEPTDGDDEKDILWRDFGVNGPGHVALYDLVYRTFPQELQDRIDGDLEEVSLWMHPSWREWA